MTELDAAEARAVLASGGRSLADTVWGPYVSLLVDEQARHVLRAPFGSLPVCLARRGPVLIAGSDLDLLVACGCATGTVDWIELARHLAASDIRRSATCLTGVSELRGGSRLSIASSSERVESVWTPWRAASLARGAPREGAAHQRLASVVDTSTAAIAGQARHSLLLLSGGLDSSILAASLAAAGQPTTALTFVTDEPAGDERHYARATAQKLGIELVEVERDPGQVDIMRSDSANAARPTRRSFLQDSRIATERVAAEVGADLVIEGGGGDNVFCSLQSVTPVADRILAGGSWREVRATAREIAVLTQAPLPAILLRAWYRARLRRAPLRVARDTSLLTVEAAELSRDATVHPWLELPASARPGSAAHVALLIAAQGWVESFDPLARIPTVCPLLAQPVVEACLEVPSWRWFAGGHNRAPAREAFAGRLPPLIVGRRSKATPDSFVTRLYERNRGALRDMLLEGRLVANGIVDAAALEAVLRETGPPRTHDHRRVMRIADAEAWARAAEAGGR